MRDGRDFRGAAPPCRIHRGSNNSVGPEIYAGPLAITKETNSSVRGYCINCSTPLNWLNSRKIFLCHSCQAKWQEGLLVVVCKNDILGIPGKDTWEDSEIGIVEKIFKNGGLKLKFLKK